MGRWVRVSFGVVIAAAVLAACGDKKTNISGATGGDLPNNGFPTNADSTSKQFPKDTAFRFCLQIEPHGGSSDLKPALTLTNPLAGQYTGEFGTGPDGPVEGTGVEMPPSNVIIFTFPITKFGLYDHLTLKNPNGTPIDLGSVTTGLPLTINAQTDKPTSCDPTKLESPPASASDNGSSGPGSSGSSNGSSSASPIDVDHDAVVKFLPQFEHAVQVDDVSFLVAALDPAVTQRYTPDQCASAFRSTKPDPTAKFTFKAFRSGPEPYDYATDGMSTTVQNTYNVAIARTANGTSSDGGIHLSVHAGKVGWFTDCTV